MSAGASIRLFLLEMSVALVLVVVGAILARQWWAKRQKRQRWVAESSIRSRILKVLCLVRSTPIGIVLQRVRSVRGY